MPSRGENFRETILEHESEQPRKPATHSFVIEIPGSFAFPVENLGTGSLTPDIFWKAATIRSSDTMNPISTGNVENVTDSKVATPLSMSAIYDSESEMWKLTVYCPCVEALASVLQKIT
jgi:hypothetical protein